MRQFASRKRHFWIKHLKPVHAEMRMYVPSKMKTAGTTRSAHRSTKRKINEWVPSQRPTKHHTATSIPYTIKIYQTWARATTKKGTYTPTLSAPFENVRS